MARKKSKAALAAEGAPVSPNNPCPFLRSLVGQGLLADGLQPVGRVAATVAKVAATGDGSPRVPAAAVYGIALVALGLAPWTALRTGVQGIRLDRLRDGPLDKHGVGSGILDAKGRVVAAELARLDEFASDHTGPDGRPERGLDLPALRRFMDANFARAAGRRRAIDRKLMDGEWPVLLKVMGRDGSAGRYLSLAELRTLFTERRLPQRMLDKLA